MKTIRVPSAQILQAYENWLSVQPTKRNRYRLFSDLIRDNRPATSKDMFAVSVQYSVVWAVSEETAQWIRRLTSPHWQTLWKAYKAQQGEPKQC